MKNISGKWLRRFVGFAGERDEYQEKMIYKVLGNANVLTFYLLSVWMFVWLHIVFLFLYGDPVDISLVDVGTIVVSSILFGVLMYYFTKSNLRLIKE